MRDVADGAVMSEIPFRQSGSSGITLETDGKPTPVPTRVVSTGTSLMSQSQAASSVKPSTARSTLMPHLCGLTLVVAAAVSACVPFGFWGAAAEWAGASWTAERIRWATTALAATIGVSFLAVRPIFFVLSGALFALAVTVVDLLLMGRLTRGAATLGGDGAWPIVLVVASAIFAYLVYVHPQSRAPSVRGVISFLLVALAAMGVMKGWFEGTALAQRLGPKATRVLASWDQEVRWAVAIILTAVGVSFSRTRHVHLLNALILLALAYQCVRAGYVEVRTFPELSTAGQVLALEHESYMNVDTWRWVVAAELVCLSAVLVHLSLGMGALCAGTAVAWMAVGLTVYHAMGTMSLVRASNEAIGATQPLANMGLPVPNRPAVADGSEPDSTPMTPARPGGAIDPGVLAATRHVLIGELTQLGWMLLTALFAGVIAVTGLRMISDDVSYRRIVLALLWLAFLAGAVALWRAWPKDSEQSWAQWAAAFKFSRYHIYLFWLAFVGAMAVAGLGALARRATVGGWVHASIASVFLATATTLVGAAVLIRFAGFPPLPVWVYCVIAAGQSALGWVLLLHVNPPAGRTVVTVL